MTNTTGRPTPPAENAEIPQLKLSPSRFRRRVYAVLGFISSGLGLAGAFLPVLPTTPFLIVAAFFFSRSSERFYNGLMNHRILGPYIRDWVLYRRIPVRAKIVAVGLIITGIGSSVVFFIPIFAVKVVLALIGLAVIAFIISAPSE